MKMFKMTNQKEKNWQVLGKRRASYVFLSRRLTGDKKLPGHRKLWSGPCA